MKLVQRCICLFAVVFCVVGCDLAGDWPDVRSPESPAASAAADGVAAVAPTGGSGDAASVDDPASAPPTPVPEDGLAVTAQFLEAINRLVRDARPAPPAATPSPFACALAAPESPEREEAESRYDSYVRQQERWAEERASAFDDLMGDRWVWDPAWQARRMVETTRGCYCRYEGYRSSAGWQRSSSRCRDGYSGCSMRDRETRFYGDLPYAATGEMEPPVIAPYLMRLPGMSELSVPDRLSCRMVDVTMTESEGYRLMKIECAPLAGGAYTLFVSAVAQPGRALPFDPETVGRGTLITIPLATGNPIYGPLLVMRDRDRRGAQEWEIGADAGTIQVVEPVTCQATWQLVNLAASLPGSAQ